MSVGKRCLREMIITVCAATVGCSQRTFLSCSVIGEAPWIIAVGPLEVQQMALIMLDRQPRKVNFGPTLKQCNPYLSTLSMSAGSFVGLHSNSSSIDALIRTKKNLGCLSQL